VRRRWGERLQGFDAVMISPGPGTPAGAGASIAVVRLAAESALPLLGVCLGHQAIGEAFGGVVGEAPELMHGMVSQVTHDGSSLFDGIRSPFAAGRYHSLALSDDSLPSALRVTARAEQGTIMAVQHESLPIVGVQFHPESVLTEGGHRLLGNWLTSVRRGHSAAATQ
jgi:para-aminobenzoate synthetase component 2